MGVRSWVRKVCRGDKLGQCLGPAVSFKKGLGAPDCSLDYRANINYPYSFGSNFDCIESEGRQLLQAAYRGFVVSSLNNTRNFL